MGCHGNYAFSHISPNRSFFENIFFRIKGIPGNNFDTDGKLSLGCKVG